MTDIARLLARDAPAAAPRWNGFARYNFIGGHNDPALVPVDALAETAARVIRDHGHELGLYNAEGPLGRLALRRFVAEKLRARRGIAHADAEAVLITSGSLQALDLVFEMLVEPGDTVLVEQFTYGGTLERLARRRARVVGVPLDDEGIDIAALETLLRDLQREGVAPKLLYTIPTIQNPTGSVLPPDRRGPLLRLAEAYGFLVFEDECYAELLWEGEWPQALAGHDSTAPVIHIGSFSKTLAPALRLGYVHAPWPLLGRLLALKTDAGTPAIEQMVVADYFGRAFDAHVRTVKAGLGAKAEVMASALEEEFGTAAEFARSKGGIFLWVRLPEAVDTTALAAPALAAEVAITPGASWSTDSAAARSTMRLCFACPSADEIRAGVATLAEVCHRETGVPARGANRQR